MARTGPIESDAHSSIFRRFACSCFVTEVCVSSQRSACFVRPVGQIQNLFMVAPPELTTARKTRAVQPVAAKIFPFRLDPSRQLSTLTKFQSSSQDIPTFVQRGVTNFVAAKQMHVACRKVFDHPAGAIINDSSLPNPWDFASHL